MDWTRADTFFDSGAYDFVRFEQSDLHGLSRSKTIPVAHFRHYAESGLNFFGGLLGLDLQGGVAPGTGYMDERRYADHLIWPDHETLAPVPWQTNTAKVICQPSWYDGKPAEAHPRYLLQEMLRRLESKGYLLRGGFEYELYLINALDGEPVFNGIQIFWTLRNDFDAPFMSELLHNLEHAGIDIITSNAEYGPGQMEINFAPATGIEAADLAFTFKNGVKEMAQQAGYMASFMTKPYAGHSASGGHFHQSLLEPESGNNAFYDPNAEDGLSSLAKHWIAGQLAHARALCALAAPTVNCAKRFKLHSFAPMNVTWGHEDRTAAIRVKGSREGETHVENRVPGAAANPYLVAAGMVAAGLDGIEKGLEPPAPTEKTAYDDENAPKLPQSLDESLQALESDTDLCGYLGQEFVTLFTAVKRHEIEKAKAAVPEYESVDWPNMVTDWERDNLFEYL